MAEERLIRTKLEALAFAIAAALIVALVVQEVPRVLFPWDLRMFSESALLTDMMKLTAGQSTYTSPGDCNSFLYAPGLEYVTYAVLRPFGAQLDVRACRAVSVAIGFASAFAVGAIVARLAAQLAQRPKRRAVHVVAGCAAALVIFKSYTADACHPDNLYGLHAMAMILLAYATVESASVRLGLLTLAFAALAVVVKQTGILGFFGATAVVVFFCWRRWGVARSAAIVAWGLVCLCAATYVVFRGWGKFWAFDLPSHQAVELFRIHRLVANVVGVPHRFLLFLAFAPSLLYIAMVGAERTKKLLVVWGAIGVTEALPSLVSYFKILGFWNNLTIIDLWAAIPVFAALATVAHAPRSDHPIATRAIVGGALVTLLVTLTPTRSLPTHEQFRFGRQLDAAVARHHAEGKRVLLNIGASTLVHDGILDVPLDRASSAAERSVAGFEGFTDTRARIDGHYYGAIYLLGHESPGYPAEIQAAIDAHYHEVGRIDADASQALDTDQLGFMGMMRSGARVLEPNP